MKDNISISILDSNNAESFINNIYEIRNNYLRGLKDKLDLHIHFDIMDNKFVQNIGTNLEYIKIAKKLDMFSDVHLMVGKPIEDGYIDKSIKYGANRITIHYELDNFEKILDYLSKYDVNIGVAIKPDTGIKDLVKYRNKFDTILIMTVEPGFGRTKIYRKCK